MRRAVMRVTYQGKDISKDLAAYLLSASYTDHAGGMADDLTIRLRDDEGLWRGDWLPQPTERVEAVLVATDWRGPKDNHELRLGSFEVDEVRFSGAPDVVEIKASSAFVTQALRQEVRTRGWKSTSLKAVAGEIAKEAKISLDWQAPTACTFERLDQRDESDLSFLDRLCRERSLALKVHDAKLVVYSPKDQESRKPAMTIERGVSTLSGYSLAYRTSGTYRACAVAWKDASKAEDQLHTFTPDDAPAVGQTLNVQGRVESLAAAQERARAELREANQDALSGDIPLMGDPRLAAGMVVRLKGFGSFDTPNWFIEQCVHGLDASGGYRTDLSIRKILGY